MERWAWIPLIVVAALVAIRGALMFAGAWRLRRLVWRPMRAKRIATAAVPPVSRLVLDAARPRLEALGFTELFVLAQESAVERDDDPLEFVAVHRHHEGLVWAVVARHVLPEAAQPYTIRWITCFDDGTNWCTLNGYLHLVMESARSWTYFDDVLPSDAQALARHEDRLRNTLHAGIVDDHREIEARLVQVRVDEVPSMLRDGALELRPDQRTARLRWLPALAAMGRVAKGHRRAASTQRHGQHRPLQEVDGKAPAAPAPNETAAAIEADVQAFGDHLALQRASPMDRRGKWTLFVVSAALFLALGVVLGAWQFIVMLLGVIALHEGGHYVAMKWVGYRNLSVFFVPGLGGLATGEKPTATPFEKLLVYLAGPVPGLVLAVAGLWAMSAGAFEPMPWFRTFLFICLVVNYLNLLPITPLDGGRIVDALFLARTPWLRFGFAALGAVALLAFGWSTDDPVMLTVAALVGIGLPLQWQLARVHRNVSLGRDEQLDEVGATRRLFEAMHRSTVRGLSFGRRAAIAKMLLPELRGPRAGWRHALVGGAIYAVCLAVPLVVAYPEASYLFGRDLSTARHDPLPRDDVDESAGTGSCARPRDADESVAERLERIDELPEAQRIGVLLEAADEDAHEGREKEAATKIDRAWALAEKRPVGDEPRARVLMARADVDPIAAQRWLRQAVSELGNGSAGSRSLLAQAEQQLAQTLGDGREQVELLGRAVAHRTEAGESPEWIAATRLELAKAHYRLRALADVDAALRANVDAAPAPAPDDRSGRALQARTLRARQLTEQGWWYLSQQRGPEAREAASAARRLVPGVVSVSWHVPDRGLTELELWVALDEKQPDGIRTAWQAHQAARQRASGRSPYERVETARTQLVVARALGDDDMQRDARTSWGSAVRALRAPVNALCAGPIDTWRSPWSQQPQRARSDAARAAGWCPVGADPAGVTERQSALRGTS